MKNIIVTGGAGFVGSNLCLRLKREFPQASIFAFDNLHRRGSELSLPRLAESGVHFHHGDIRVPSDLESLPACDLLIDCSAEPSVMAGMNGNSGGTEYVTATNLLGTLHCLEFCRKHGAAFLFLSTSRVYPIEAVNNISYVESDSRFTLAQEQQLPGVSAAGIAENFSLEGARSLYGCSKLASELFIQEFSAAYGIRSIINRCGVISGPWQMGKVDQGVVVLWVARHIFGKELAYFGYGGTGKQVRDVLHIDDLYDLLSLQIQRIHSWNAETYNVGGGLACSTSLLELTRLCQKVTDREVPIKSVVETRSNDIRMYITDCSKVGKEFNWQPSRTMPTLVEEIAAWITTHRHDLERILG